MANSHKSSVKTVSGNDQLLRAIRGIGTKLNDLTERIDALEEQPTTKRAKKQRVVEEEDEQPTRTRSKRANGKFEKRVEEALEAKNEVLDNAGVSYSWKLHSIRGEIVLLTRVGENGARKRPTPFSFTSNGKLARNKLFNATRRGKLVRRHSDEDED